MAIITMVSGKGAPGVTTSVAALATVWPHPVLVVDADPAGGDLLAGWLGQWWIDGWLQAETGVLGFAGATRHHETVSAGDLSPQVQVIPGARHARVLTGLRHPRQNQALGQTGWQRVATAAGDLTRHGGPDVLVDAGRYDDRAPWPLIRAADLVLLALRPGLRHIGPALATLAELGESVPIERLGAAVCASTSREADNTAAALGIPVGLELPDDVAAARLLSEGGTQPPKPRSPLLRTARRAASRLHTRLNTPAVSVPGDAEIDEAQTTSPEPVPALDGGTP